MRLFPGKISQARIFIPFAIITLVYLLFLDYVSDYNIVATKKSFKINLFSSLNLINIPLNSVLDEFYSYTFYSSSVSLFSNNFNRRIGSSKESIKSNFSQHLRSSRISSKRLPKVNFPRLLSIELPIYLLIDSKKAAKNLVTFVRRLRYTALKDSRIRF